MDIERQNYENRNSNKKICFYYFTNTFSYFKNLHEKYGKEFVIQFINVMKLVKFENNEYIIKFNTIAKKWVATICFAGIKHTNGVIA